LRRAARRARAAPPPRLTAARRSADRRVAAHARDAPPPAVALLLTIGANFFAQLGSDALDDAVALVEVAAAGAVTPLAGATTAGFTSAAAGGAWGAPLYGEGADFSDGGFAALGGHSSAAGAALAARGFLGGALLPPPAARERVVQAAFGLRAALARAASGAVFEVLERRAARRVDELPRAAADVAAGDATLAAVDVAGHAWTWGANASGQCALGAGAPRDVPRATRVDAFDGMPVGGGGGGGGGGARADACGAVARVAVGTWATAFLLATGDVFLGPALLPAAAGAPGAPLGDAGESDAPGPARGVGGARVALVDALPGDVVALAAGARHWAALTARGDVWVWGAACAPAPLPPGARAEPLGAPAAGAGARGARARLVGALGAAAAWGLAPRAPPTRLDLGALVRACGGGGGAGEPVRAAAIAAGGGVTVVALAPRAEKRAREEGRAGAA